MRSLFGRERGYRLRKRIPRGRRGAAATLKRTLFVAVPLLISGALYAFFFSRTFALEYIDVSADGGIDPSRVRAIIFQEMDERKRFNLFPQDNIFAFDDASAERALRDAFVVHSAVITKVLPKTLRISISGKPFRALWFTNGLLYDITTRGMIAGTVEPEKIAGFPPSLASSFQNASTTPSRGSATSTPPLVKTEKHRGLPSGIPIVVDEGNESVELESAVLSESALQYILALSAAAAEVGVHSEYLKTKRGATDVRIVTNEGWEILTTNREDPREQMKALSLLIREKVRGDRKKLLYVDVRFGNRVYFVAQ